MNEVINFLEKEALNKKELKLDCFESGNIDVKILLDLLVPDDELNNEVINKYENIKEKYKFIVLCCLFDKTYNVFIDIMDDENLYFNVLRRNFNDDKTASDYFDELSAIIKNNDLNSLSKILIERLTN